MAAEPVPPANVGGLFLAVTDGGTSADHAPIPLLPVLVGAATGSEFNLVRAPILPVACWRLGDVRFHFDSSFVVPEARTEFQTLKRLITDHSRTVLGQLVPPPLSIFGHADPTGNDDYNKALSGRRAAAIYGALTRRTDIWEDLFSNTAKFSPTAPGDQWGAPAVTAIRGALKQTGSSKTNAAERRILFAQYMDFLCIDERVTPFQVDPVDGFLGAHGDALGKGDYQGCSEFNPILLLSRQEQAQPQVDRDAANAPNRRVMVFLFRPGSKVTPALWPCPRIKEPTQACRKRFFSDAEKRRALGNQRRQFKDNEDTFACRFYQRLATRSPCERGDKPPLIVALFDTHSEPRDAEMRLLVFDGSDTEVDSIPGERATDAQDGFFLFRLNLSELPDPVRLEWLTDDGAHHLAGPCSPTELRDALSTPDLNRSKALVGEPRQDPNPASPDTPPSDDVLVNIISDSADGESLT